MAENQPVAREMQHRIANSLTLAESLARQTNRHSRSPEEFDTAFGGRIQALAASNRLLAENGWSSASIRALLDAILQPWTSPKQRNVELIGPDVRLDLRSAMALSLGVQLLPADRFNVKLHPIQPAGVGSTIGPSKSLANPPLYSAGKAAQSRNP